MKNYMKHRYAVVVLTAMIVAAGLTSLLSYRATRTLVNEDMERTLAMTMQEQRCEVINEDTIRAFNNHLRIRELRGKATLAVEADGRQFHAYAQCSEATIFRLSDQRMAAVLWLLTMVWAALAWHWRMRTRGVENVSSASLGGLRFVEAEGRFVDAEGHGMPLTPMQQQLMEMFFRAPAHCLSKSEICAALWPGKPDASETLYTLIRRLRPVVERDSALRIETDRGRAYRLVQQKRKEGE